jgi:hypothetical protein
MKNGKPANLETRLERLEADVKEIKAMLQAQPESKGASWRSFVGMFANDPVADEVRKITEEIQEKERRKARRARSKKKAGA